MKNAIACALIAGTLLSGCATRQFVKGEGLKPSETVLVVTDPAGAIAENGHGNSCSTPCYIPLLRARGGEITVSKDGYHTERFQITSSVTDRKVAMRSADFAVEAIDPDPVSIGLTALAHALDGKGGVMELDTKDITVTMRPLAPGEEDLLADAEPLTGERIPLDEWEPAGR